MTFICKDMWLTDSLDPHISTDIPEELYLPKRILKIPKC